MLPSNIQEQIDSFCHDGDAYAARGEFDEALDAYHEAERLIPDPKTDWEAATWIYTAIGDALFYKSAFADALQYFTMAIVCPDGLGNPFIHLRLGQCQFEHGNFEKSADELARAFMSEGEEIFLDEDPKYRAFLATRINTS